MLDIQTSGVVFESGSYNPPWRPSPQEIVTTNSVASFSKLLRPIESMNFLGSLAQTIEPQQPTQSFEPTPVCVEKPVEAEDFKHAVDQIFEVRSSEHELN